MKGSAIVKRIIIIPLIMLLICSTSFTVFSVPQNVITLEVPISLHLRFRDLDDNTVDWDNFTLWYYSVNNDFVKPFKTGEVYFHFWEQFIDERVSSSTSNIRFDDRFSLTYSLTMPGECDLVVALPSTVTVLSRTDFSYTKASYGVNVLINGNSVIVNKLYTENYTNLAYRLKLWLNTGIDNITNQDLRAYMWDAGTATDGRDGTVEGSTFTIPMTYYSFSDLKFGDVITIETGSNSYYNLSHLGVPTPGMPLGIFVTSYDPFSIYDSWTDPDLSYSDNVNTISSTLKALLEGANTVDEKIFFTGLAQYQLENFVVSSNCDFVDNGIIFSNELDSVLSDFNSFNIDYITALEDFSDLYISSLEEAETIEQGNYITSIYQIKQQALQQFALKHASDRLNAVVTDDDREFMDNYYASEDALLSQLSLQRLEDTITYQEWFNIASDSESLVFKSIYDWFFTDSSFRYWLVVPMTFVIVSILLGTTIRMSGRFIRNSDRNGGDSS